LGFVRQVAALLFIIALPVAFVTTNVRVAVNEPRLYEYSIDHHDAVKTTGIEREELLRGSDELRGYFNSDETALAVQVSQDGQQAPLFTPRETQHLQDVKTLFRQSFRVQEAAVIFVLAYVVAVFIWAQEVSLRALAGQVLTSALVGLAVIGVVGALAVTGFDQSFEQFHQIAFDNDLWRLDPDRDRLIQMFPEAFWRDVSVWIGLATMAELALAGLLSAVYLGLTRRSPVRLAPAGGAA